MASLRKRRRDSSVERHVVDIIPEYRGGRDETRDGGSKRGAVLISRVGDATPRAIHVAPLSACPYARQHFCVQYTFLIQVALAFLSLSLSLSFLLSQGKRATAHACKWQVARRFYFVFESRTCFFGAKRLMIDNARLLGNRGINWNTPKKTSREYQLQLSRNVRVWQLTGWLTGDAFVPFRPLGRVEGNL